MKLMTVQSIKLLSSQNVKDTLFQPGDYNKYILPWWRQLIWTILAASMVIIATGGNLIVIYIVLADRRMRTVTNYLLVNLSIADVLVSVFNISFNFSYMINYDWHYGHFYCKFCQFVAVLSICGSIFTLMAISVERYIAIVHPLRPRMSEQATIGVAASIWLLGSLLSLPNLLFATTYTLNYKDGSERTICYIEWPDAPSGSEVDDGNGTTTKESLHENLYNLSFMFLTYFLPLAAIGYAYSRVAVELWGSQVVGEATPHQLENIQAKRKVVKMMLVVVFIFAICWLPNNVYFLVVTQNSSIADESYIQELYLFVWFLSMSNSMYNPFIYCWMNARFREGFKRVLRKCLPPCCKTRQGTREIYRYSCYSPDTRVFRNGSSRLPVNHLTVGNWSRSASSRRTLSTLAPESRRTSPMSMRNWQPRTDPNENHAEGTVDIQLANIEIAKPPADPVPTEEQIADALPVKVVSPAESIRGPSHLRPS